MTRIIKYLVTTIFFVFLAASYPLASIQAQEAQAGADATPEVCSWIGQSMSCFTQVLKKADKGALQKEGSEFATMVNSINSLAIMIGGAWETSNAECPQALNFQKGALSGIGGSITAIYTNPPASSSIALMDLGRSLGFVTPQAYAQGIGFSGLSALLPLWKVFRDISYGILAIILIVVGLMVMFRKKIDPKTVVTVQNSIPRIVVALLLVTFSYAIVGLLIDGMYLLIALAISMISSSSVGDNIGKALSVTASLCKPSAAINAISGLVGGPTANLNYSTKEATDFLFSGGMWSFTRFFFGSGIGAWNDVGDAFGGKSPWVQVASFAVPGLLGAFIGGTKGALLGLSLFSGPGLLILIILLVLLFGFVRILFMLIDAYINIIIALLTAPFQLVLEAIPGSTSFSSWLRHLLSKIIVFPITIVLLLVSAILTYSDSATAIWAPPLLSGDGDKYGMAGIIGLGMLLVIPTFVAGIQKSMKAEPAIPGGVGAMFGPLGQGVGSLMNIWYQGSMIKSMFGSKGHGPSPSQVVRKGSQQGFGALTGEGQNEEHS